MIGQLNAVQSTKSVQEVSKQSSGPKISRFPKSDLRYWQAVIFQPTYTRAGQTHQVADWSAKIQHRGRRETFALESPNRAAAAGRAKEIFLSLQAVGWDGTLAKFKPGATANVAPNQNVATVGEFITEVKAKSALRERTFEEYAKAFRKIVADIHKIDGGRKKFDHFNGGRDAWVQRINEISLATITPERIQSWKIDFIRRAGESATKKREARNSVNAFIRNARSLFSAKLLKFARIKLPEVLPFAGVEFEARSSMRYRSEIDAATLVPAAREELAPTHPEQYKIFLLSIMAGLRRNEIDLLEWPSMDYRRNVIRIQRTKYYQPKNEDSLGDVEVDPEVLKVFRDHEKQATGAFVIESKNPPKPNAKYSYHRCKKDFDAVVTWLRSKGVRANTPLHSMRKEFGSLLCEQGGIYEASRALRHADIRTTSAHYLDRKRRVTVGLGNLLTTVQDTLGKRDEK